MGMGAKQPGCFRYGCFIATILAVVVFGSLTWWSIRSVRQAFFFYTSDSPTDLTGVHTVSEITAERGRAKLHELSNAFSANTSAKMDFSADELMGVLEAVGFRRNIDLSFDGDRVTARFSAPLSLFGEWTAAEKLVGNVAERFLTGEFVGTISIIDNSPKVEFDRLVLNGSVLEEMARGHAASWLEGAVRSVVQSSNDTSRLAKVVIADSLLKVSLAEEEYQGGD